MSKRITRLFHIDIHYACFGIETTDNIVTLTAPIAAWMKGKSLAEIKPWLLGKGAVVKEVKI